MQCFRRLFQLYTRGEVIRLVNQYLEEVRQGHDLVDLPQGAERDKWCMHVEVGFEKWLVQGGNRR